ncbi:H-NS family nucleoid-associated regulatory protein [Yoonia vestfoldensis]|jgi:DNA-binding protein H-NS|uniref:Trans-acting regulatory protein HvrA n=1 Tax=Yoonia vestfoldensis TaxID=245188 RepID=A0A1Y0EER2_9RHOB|nr:H-NS histone family protein [Yoonia vestfoldensis]ARU02084.1 trans-acting regulatory protein HvrA [Yoonia vestfoldensis]
MNKDLSSMTRSELEALKRQVEKAMVDVAEKDKKAALAAAEKAAAEHGFSLAEITGAAARKGKTGSKSSAPAKYRNPADSSQTWTGKGRQPAWFKQALANGTSPEAMEI